VPPKKGLNASINDQEAAPLLQNQQEKSQPEEVADKKGLIMSIVILLLSIPALIGA